ncbi:putative Nucleoside 2 deoxyribosyltransferase [Trypanosoma vivax]|uniref:Nucleoside 2-deoxyribosyltransferase n=1 Tax=Trypanosoma vivax (strain Y486) TaxID=1055687 RepID=G0U4Z6_TRYVY|nr:hypothetical protein TRVL_01305 [Trypanosoma vivax]KAH8614193.1 putative Nucleoside 2 deoxyribosyltransferase [Trypanosoma vivax]CCC52511.1 conserved hypothetical protein [Trypanosoma vivax Y486]
MPSGGKSIYIAGPAVFNADMGAAYYNGVRELLRKNGVVPLIPTDSKATDAPTIRAKNMEMIRNCDAVIADLSPFRGHEPDCGTAFEVGYAIAQNKAVITFTTDQRTMRERYGARTDKDGLLVEDFGLPHNLMLCDGEPVHSSFEEAFQHFLLTHGAA